MVAIQIAEELAEKIQQGAQRTGRTSATFLREAVLSHLDELDDIAIAEERLKDPGQRTALADIGKQFGPAATTVEIPDELNAGLQQTADSLGRSKDDLVREALRACIEESSAAQSEFTPAALARLHEGFHAAVNGDLVPQEEIEAFFDDWERELRS